MDKDIQFKQKQLVGVSIAIVKQIVEIKEPLQKVNFLIAIG